MITSAKFWTKTKSLAVLAVVVMAQQIQPRQIVFKGCLRQRDRVLAQLALGGLDRTQDNEEKLRDNLKELVEIP